MDSNSKLPQAIDGLRHALGFEKQAQKDAFYVQGIAKAFEVAVEYGWKYLKQAVNEEGLEAYGPKDSIRLAARMGLIDDPDGWIDAVNTRNLSVHDYISIPEEELIPAAKSFLLLACKLK